MPWPSATWPRAIGPLRSGTGGIWGNTVTGNYLTFCKLSCGRQAGYFKCWGGADGLSAFDINDTADHKGNGYGGGPGGLYGSGTHTGATGSTTLVVSVGSPGNPAPGRAANQWKGYEFLNTTQHNVSVCTKNTVDTIMYIASFGPGFMK